MALREVFELPDPSSYRTAARSRIVQEYLPAVPLGAAFNFVVAALALAAGDSHAAGILLAIGALFCLSYPIAASAPVRRRGDALVLCMGAACAFGAATTCSVGPSFEHAGWAILIVCWGMGATQLSLSVWALGVGIAVQIVVFLAVREAKGLAPPPAPWVVAAIMVSAALLALQGCRSMQRRDETLFEEEASLRRREAELRDWEARVRARRDDLARQAEAQVHELVHRAHSIQALEALLSERVGARSRQIAEHVERVSSLPDIEPFDGTSRP
jgi:hypothetical protein